MRIEQYQDVILELESQLNKACELLVELEHNADEEQQTKIDALFAEIKYTQELNSEMDADLEAQSWIVFKENKI